jgi:hypothetical protein
VFCAAAGKAEAGLIRPLSRQARELRSARVCYDHLAGRLSVDFADFFTRHDYIVLGDEGAQVTEEGARFLAEFGIDLISAANRRHRICRSTAVSHSPTTPGP